MWHESETALERTVPGGRDATTDGASLDAMVTELILTMRIPAHINGYHYIRKAIILAVENQYITSAYAKALYPSIAKAFSTTPGRIERGIRYALRIAWDRCDFGEVEEKYGPILSFAHDKPANLEFIACAADYFRMKCGIGTPDGMLGHRIATRRVVPRDQVFSFDA